MTPPAAAAAPAVRRARSTAPARPLTRPQRPRRVSGPARPASRQRSSAQAEGGLALGAIAALRSVDRHPLFDRLIVGRTWIAIVAFALIGIVTLQLGLLKLNAGIGRTLEQESSLQRENAALSIENSELAGGNRVESSAARLGMQLVPIGLLRYLDPSSSADVARAAAALDTPVHSASTSEAEAGSSAATSDAATSDTSSTTTSDEAGASPAASSSQDSEASTTPTAAADGGEAASSTSESSAAPTTQSASRPAATPEAPAAGVGSTGEASPAGGTQAGPTG
jgi:cell division protein FtsL